MGDNKKKCYMTISFTILNVIAYIIYTIMGEIVYNTGSLSAVDIIDKQQYYRIISCIFLHAGVEHLFGNMLFLVILGEMLENAVGHVRFGLIYMVAGIGSSLFSMAYEVISGSYYHTVGASGAVCGLIGALLVLVIKNNGRFGALSLPRMILAIVYLIYSGTSSPVVNNAAHIGGLLVGFLIMLIMMKGIGVKRCED